MNVQLLVNIINMKKLKHIAQINVYIDYKVQIIRFVKINAQL